jgi:DTW domain-containing protein YfiP
MKHRYPKIPRCRGCGMAQEDCLCVELRSLREQWPANAPSFSLLLHWREFKTTTNTGILGVRAAPQGTLCMGGLADPSRHPHPESQAERVRELRERFEGTEVADSNFDANSMDAILFPDPSARAVSTKDVFTRVLVPDGTWDQSRRMVRKLPSSIPRIQLSQGALLRAREWQESESGRLRKARTAGRLSTAEAMALLLGDLGFPTLETELHALYKLRVERTLRRRHGVLDDCTP